MLFQKNQIIFLILRDFVHYPPRYDSAPYVKSQKKSVKFSPCCDFFFDFFEIFSQKHAHRDFQVDWGKI